MQKSSSSPAKTGFGVHDVLFILFKHKWMILSLTLLGLGAAAFMFSKQEPVYTSSAKLLVRYVKQTGTSVDPYETMKHPTGGMRGGDPVINTEIELLNNLDLAKEVVAGLEAEKAGGASAQAAEADYSWPGAAVLAAIEVVPGRSPNVLYVSFTDPDPETSIKTLDKIVEVYFKRHLEIHRSAAAFDLIAKQAEEMKLQLKKTEDELNALRTSSGMLSLEESYGVLSAQRARTQQDLMDAKAQFAEQQANLAAMEEMTGLGAAELTAEPASDSTSPPSGDLPPPELVVTEYRKVMELISFLQKRELELRLKFKPGNQLLTLNQQQLDTYDARRRSLIQSYPNLVAQAAVATSETGNAMPDFSAQKARLAATSAKINVLEAHLDEIAKQFGEQYVVGSKIQELDRRRAMEDAEYRALEAELKSAKINVTLDPSRMPNINLIQEPSAPVKAYDEKAQKIILGIAGSGLALGLGIAFLLELLLDRRVKRPIEIQTRLQLPLLLSIPFIRRKERGGFMLTRDSDVPRIDLDDDERILDNGLTELALENTPSRMGHFILPYSETVRDRIIFNFEVNNVTHKPKLVAVTGLSEGAGASTIAAGLAKSFSEINGVKVLLVDLSSFHPEDSPLFGEIPRHSLNGALNLAESKSFRQTQQNLYYASANARRDETGLTTFSPVHLYELLPQLKASDYDYIIFDMPPIDQTSRTLTMAGLMDKVLLVLDAENTSRDGLLWGYSELVKGRADVSCIFNKTRSHVPSWLIGEN